MMTYADPDTAFRIAIRTGRLSDDSAAPHYAGRFMYMGTRNGIDLFKHIDTRAYLPDPPPAPVDADRATRQAIISAGTYHAPYRCQACRTAYDSQIRRRTSVIRRMS